jgi:uroporphyrinogen-III decarboxylase
MMDYYDHPEELKTCFQAVLEYYKILIKRLSDVGVHGVIGSEDLGFQTNLFMPPSIFREFYKPLYREMADLLHAHDMDFWMHSCGHITEIIPDLIDAGVDVLHPIQAGTMDDEGIVRDFGGKIAFNVGMDVQHLIPSGTVEEVREGVEERFRLFFNPRGGAIYSAGNVIMDGTPIENIRAYVETLYKILE